ncbi:hypothetical protein J6590_001368 [Homalodisca vitripennis]|nr:hypothetical protein J6590_001368 [Homalodisca vitripennis]
MDQIRQCMDNKDPSRVKFRRAEPDPPLLAVRLGSSISSPVYGALRIGLVPPPPKNLFIPFSLLYAKRYAPLVPPRHLLCRPSGSQKTESSSEAFLW